MLQNISVQIENINRSLEWIKAHKPADYETRFLALVEERRKLRKLERANKDNPAIAAYGVSQVGKSYLMNAMLQKNGKQFILECDEGNFNFIEEMNPQTKNTEATGVVTRFSSFSRNPGDYSRKYPILMRCLSVTDIILILAEGYFIDLVDYTIFSDAEITEFAEAFYQKYKSMPVIPGSPVNADNVLDMKAYFEKHINGGQAFVRLPFFDRLALVADHIPAADWLDVFSVLWYRSQFQNKLFAKILTTLEKFGYSEYAYLPAQSMVHEGINANTIVSVQCLNELFLATPNYRTEAYVKQADGTFTRIPDLTKSEVSAICAEIVIKMDGDYIENHDRYCIAGIEDPRIISILSKNDKGTPDPRYKDGDKYKGDVAMSILRNNDLLDFPGARSRKKINAETLVEDSLLITVFLRGKVAYLFNMYNESRLINILLFCHHNEKNEVSEMPTLLKSWVMTYVGETMEKRRRTLELTGGISPLFFVGTKFNVDMQCESSDVANSENAINGRWFQRFRKTLYDECFNVDGTLDNEKNKIYLNWTAPGETFNNGFILRDYKYSSPKYSQLYKNERSATETAEMTMAPEYYKRLRDTFVTNPDVAQFIKDPALTWDASASINNDGALFIIDHLAQIAERMDRTRDAQFKAVLEGSMRKVLDTVSAYFVSTDIDKMLAANIRKAKAIFRELDFTCNTDNYYFGHLIQYIQLTETESYKIIHEVMQSPEINSQVNDFKDYEIIRNSCANAGYDLDSLKSDDERWDALLATYGFSDREDARDFMARKGVDVTRLFTGTYKRKLNSFIIADKVFDWWVESIKSVDFFTEFADNKGFDGVIMNNLVEDLVAAANAVNLRDALAGMIAEYVNVVNIHTAVEPLLADMLSSKVNDFINDFGYSYLSDEEKAKVKRICRENKLPTYNYIERPDPVTTVEDLTAMFNTMSTSATAILPSFEENYGKWVEYMFISFVSHLNIPDFDIEANRVLEGIIDDINKSE